MPLTDISDLMVLNVEAQSDLHRKGPRYSFFRRNDDEDVFCNVTPCARVALVLTETNIKKFSPKRPTCTGKIRDGFYVTGIRNTDMFIVM